TFSFITEGSTCPAPVEVSDGSFSFGPRCGFRTAATPPHSATAVEAADRHPAPVDRGVRGRPQGLLSRWRASAGLACDLPPITILERVGKIVQDSATPAGHFPQIGGIDALYFDDESIVGRERDTYVRETWQLHVRFLPASPSGSVLCK